MHSVYLSPLAARWIAAVVFALCAMSVRADYVWIAPGDGGVPMIHAGALDGERRPVGEFDAIEPRPVGEVKPELVPADDQMRLTGAPKGKDLRVRAREVRDDGVLVYYQARWGRTETSADLDFELVPTEAGGNTFRLMWMGSPVKVAYVRVTTSAGWSKTVQPSKDGSVTVDTPFPGLYVLQFAAKASGWAEVDGKRYTDVRHTATLSFTVK